MLTSAIDFFTGKLVTIMSIVHINIWNNISISQISKILHIEIVKALGVTV